MTTVAQELDLMKLARICRDHRVRRLSLFGSAARGQLRPESDIDALVEYDGGYTPTYLDLGALGDALSPLFGGRFVDLAMPNNLHWFIRDDVLSSAVTIYEG
jgi:hypothetical protein